MRALRHPNIVQLFDVVEEGPPSNKLDLVMELCPGGDLADALRRSGPLPEAAAGGLLRQLAAGLRALAEGHLVHRDLKPGNLLLSGPLPGAASAPTLKIADFGFARVVGPARLAATLCGSPLYMAPEARGGGTCSSFLLYCFLAYLRSRDLTLSLCAPRAASALRPPRRSSRAGATTPRPISGSSVEAENILETKPTNQPTAH